MKNSYLYSRALLNKIVIDIKVYLIRVLPDMELSFLISFAKNPGCKNLNIFALYIFALKCRIHPYEYKKAFHTRKPDCGEYGIREATFLFFLMAVETGGKEPVIKRKQLIFSDGQSSVSH